MWLALRFPHWALDSRSEATTGAPAATTTLVVENCGGKRRVVAAGDRAIEQGVRRGMALADADRVIAMEATWPKGHSRRGNALHVMGRYAEARTSYEEALRLDPTNSQVISSLKDVEKEIEKQAPQNGAA